MPDFAQNGAISTLHDLSQVKLEVLEESLRRAAPRRPIGLVLPVTAGDMRAEPFEKIVDELAGADYIASIVITLGVAPDAADYRETVEKVRKLGDRAQVIWTDGPAISGLYKKLIEDGFNLTTPGKGRSVWTAFGYLLADRNLQVFALHDCDIVDYDRLLLTRLCLPMAHPSLDFDFCKAFYARVTDRMHGRVVRLLVAPLLKSLMAVVGNDRFLEYLDSFRYPLSGEFAVTSSLARSNRIPSDWGLEVGTLAEVYRNTSQKRVCQVDLCRFYEHKHQNLSLDDPGKGLMKMAKDICASLFRTLASRGVTLQAAHFATLQAAYLRAAQDAIRQYHADSVVNGLEFNRHDEEQAVDGFSRQIGVAGQAYLDDPAGGVAIPNWSRVLAAFPDTPEELRTIVANDRQEHA